MKKLLPLAASLMIVLLVAGCDGRSPQSTLETFARNVSRLGVDTSSQIVTAQLAKDTLNELKTDNQNFFLKTAADIMREGIGIESIVDTGRVATIEYRSNADLRIYTATLVKESGSWKVKEYCSLKDLTDTQRVLPQGLSF